MTGPDPVSAVDGWFWWRQHLDDVRDGADGSAGAIGADAEVHFGHLTQQDLQGLTQFPLHLCLQTPVQTQVHKTAHKLNSL